MRRVLLWGAIMLCVTGGVAAGADRNVRDNTPDYFKVFSKDGSESLTAMCHPKNTAKQKSPWTDIACRVVHVRFQVPVPAQYTFSASIEEAMKTDPALANDFQKDPVKAQREWGKAMSGLEAEFCSQDARQRFQRKLAGLEEDSRRKQLFTELIEACARDGHAAEFLDLLSQIERSTCELSVDHFSLHFRRIDERKWLYTQQQPSPGGKLKIYELSAEPDHNLWTITETQMMVGQPDEEESRSGPERKVWSWQSWDAYEIPEQCRFISHRRVQ